MVITNILFRYGDLAKGRHVVVWRLKTEMYEKATA
jgi:hypothetical protein